MKLFLSVPGRFVLLLLIASPVQARDDLEKFLNAIPDSTNTLTIIRMRSIMESPRGLREGWAKKRESEYLEGAVLIPPTADLVVVATKLVPGDFANSPAIGFIPLTKEVDNKEFLGREKGEVQYVAGESVFKSSRNAYYVGRGTTYMAVVSPADRQELAQWIKCAKRNKQPVLSPYLLKAAAADASAQIMVAIDPEDILDPKRLEEDVRASAALAKESKAEVSSFIFLLRKLKGIRFTAQIGEDIEAVLRLDFDDKVSPEARFLKPYLLEVLGEMGAELDDFANSQVVLEEKAILLKSRISLDDLKHILTLVVPPLPKMEPPEPPKPKQAPPQLSPEELELKASLNYYRSVHKLIDELQKKSKKATDYPRTALWHETYAKRIEQLATESVNPDLLAYGANEAAKLRALADSLHGVAVEVDALQSGMYERRTSGVGIGLGWHGLSLAVVPGGGSVVSNVPEIRTMQAQAIAKGATDRLKIWNMLEEDRSAIRNRMKNKYGVEFDAK